MHQHQLMKLIQFVVHRKYDYNLTFFRDAILCLENNKERCLICGNDDLICVEWEVIHKIQAMPHSLQGCDTGSLPFQSNSNGQVLKFLRYLWISSLM